MLQDRVEGAALLEAAELRGDNTDADLDDSDADSDADADADAEVDVGSSDDDLKVHGSEAAEADAHPDDLEDATLASEVEAVSDHESGFGDETSESDGEEHKAEQSETSGSDSGLEEAADTPSSSGSQHSDVKEQTDKEKAAPGRNRKRKAYSLESELQGSELDQDKAAAESPSTAPPADEKQNEGDAQEEEKHIAEGQKRRKDAKPKLQPAADSLQTLKRQLAAAKGTGDGGDGEDGQAGVPIEWGRVLTAEDFEHIKQLRHRCFFDAPLLNASNIWCIVCCILSFGPQLVPRMSNIKT